MDGLESEEDLVRTVNITHTHNHRRQPIQLANGEGTLGGHSSEVGEETLGLDSQVGAVVTTNEVCHVFFLKETTINKTVKFVSANFILHVDI